MWSLLRRTSRDLNSFLEVRDPSCCGCLGVVCMGQHRPCVVQGDVGNPSPCCTPCLPWHHPVPGQQHDGGDLQMCARA